MTGAEKQQFLSLHFWFPDDLSWKKRQLFCLHTFTFTMNGTGKNEHFYVSTLSHSWSLCSNKSQGLTEIKGLGMYKSNKYFDHAKSNDSFRRSSVNYITLLFASSQAVQLHFYTCTMTGAGKSDNCYVSTLSLSGWPEFVLHHKLQGLHGIRLFSLSLTAQGGRPLPFTQSMTG